MSPPEPTTPRRPQCLICARPRPACLCAWTRPTDNAVELLVLQHPLEAREAKNSARLLALSLRHCQIEVGEVFDPTALAAWTTGAALLYPATESAPGPAVPAGWTPRRLVVLDATWRKSLKLLHLNPALQALPRWALVDPPAGRYAPLRRAARPHQLSTLEATCHALAQIESDTARYAPLLDAFAGWVDGQAAERSARELRATCATRGPVKA